MKSIIEMLEHLSEIAYIEDMETHEISYLNKAFREKLHVETIEEYNEQICFLPIQSSSQMCTATDDTSPFLATKFSVWTQEVPQLHGVYDCLAIPYNYGKFGFFIVIAAPHSDTAVGSTSVCTNHCIAVLSNCTHKPDQCDVCPQIQRELKTNFPLDYYLANAYHDMRFFLDAIAQNNSSTYFYFGDMIKNIYYISNNMRDRFGFDSNVVENLMDRWSAKISSEQGRERFWNEICNMLAEKRSIHDLRYQVTDKKGTRLWIHCTGIVKWNESHTKPLFFAGRIVHQDDSFVIDPITNFPTVTTLQQHLKESVGNVPETYAIGFGLHHLTQINSTQGRSAGDRLIREIANQLIDTMSGEMTFFRLPGVRCLGFINHGVQISTEAMVERIRAIIVNAYHKAGAFIQNPCSFAVMKWPQSELTPEDFLENMVSLIKVARHEPASPFVDDSSYNLQKMHQVSTMEMTINADVMNGMAHFRTVVQPVVSADTGRIIGGETLLRWTFEKNDISPAIFIPILERDRMIQIADRWVFEQAVRICSQVVLHNPDFYLTVNVSLQQLYDKQFLKFIPATLQRYHLDGRHLVVEMTESCMDEEPEKLMELVNVCKKCGIRIALDDFGSGYSSLRVLLQYPSSIIKLDRSLLLEMMDSTDKKNFIASIVFACHRFGKVVCMEGVESELQNELVRETQCDVIQGYYYYRPTEVETLYKLLHADSAS